MMMGSNLIVIRELSLEDSAQMLPEHDQVVERFATDIDPMSRSSGRSATVN
jgi:hypothetical protein